MSSGSRVQVFWLEMTYLGLLALFALLYLAGGVPAWMTGSILYVPAGVLFFGAVGGVTISLNGVFTHMSDWDPRYGLWHTARPFVGATAAFVAVLIFHAGVLSIGATAPASGGATDNPPKYVLYYVVAFVVGYRESTFRELIGRAADLVLKSQAPGVGLPMIGALDPVSLPIAGGHVKITGSGLTGTQWVRFGTQDATFIVSSDGEIDVTVPQAAGTGTVFVTLLTDHGAASYRSPFSFV
jgi:hypothetical protein